MRDMPTPDLIRLRAEYLTRPDAFRIHIRAIDLVLSDRKDRQWFERADDR